MKNGQIYQVYFLEPSPCESNKSNFTLRKINKKMNKNIREANLITQITKIHWKNFDEHKFGKTIII